MSQTTNESEDEIMSKDQSDSLLDDDGNFRRGSGGVALKKGPWTAAEDAILIDYVKKYGEGNWNSVQKHSGLFRCGKSCRLRWANHLRPNLKKGAFTPAEEQLIIELHSKMGNKWARMAAHLPGRTDNEIKNYWNTRIKRRQRAGLPLYPPELFLQALQENEHGNQNPVDEGWRDLNQSNPCFHDLDSSEVLSPYLLGDNMVMKGLESSYLGESKLALHHKQRNFTPLYNNDRICESFEPGTGGWLSYIISNNLSTSNPADSGDVKLELPSFQYTAETDVGSWVTPTTPDSADSSILSPPNSGLLDALLHEAKTLRCGKNHSSEKASDSCSDHNIKACQMEFEDYGDAICLNRSAASVRFDKYSSLEFIAGCNVKTESMDDVWMKDGKSEGS